MDSINPNLNPNAHIRTNTHKPFKSSKKVIGKLEPFTYQKTKERTKSTPKKIASSHLPKSTETIGKLSKRIVKVPEKPFSYSSANEPHNTEAEREDASIEKIFTSNNKDIQPSFPSSEEIEMEIEKMLFDTTPHRSSTSNEVIEQVPFPSLNEEEELEKMFDAASHRSSSTTDEEMEKLFNEIASLSPTPNNSEKGSESDTLEEFEEAQEHLPSPPALQRLRQQEIEEEINSLRVQINEVKNKITKKNEEYAIIKYKTIPKIQDKLEEQQNLLSSKNLKKNNILELTNNVNEKSIEERSINEKIAKIEQELAKTQEAYQKANTVLNQVNKDYEELLEEVRLAQPLPDETEATEEEEGNDPQQLLKDALEIVSQAETQCLTVAQALDDLQDSLKKRQQEHSVCIQEKETLIRQQSSKEEELVNLNKDIEIHKVLINDLQSQIDKLNQKVTETQETSNLQEELEDLSEQLTIQETELQDLKEAEERSKNQPS